MDKVLDAKRGLSSSKNVHQIAAMVSGVLLQLLLGTHRW